MKFAGAVSVQSIENSAKLGLHLLTGPTDSETPSHNLDNIKAIGNFITLFEPPSESRVMLLPCCEADGKTSIRAAFKMERNRKFCEILYFDGSQATVKRIKIRV